MAAFYKFGCLKFSRHPKNSNLNIFLNVSSFVAACEVDGGVQSDETCTSGGDNSNPGSCEEDQARLRLKRKLQRNRTSFTNEQIDSLEKGKI